MKVVFMPYLASMWDCLSKFYEKYKDIATVYVVPLPYYGKDVSGNFNKLYYDGHNFPKGIRIYNYRKFNLAKVHPDILFIHNAYDNANTIISVPPEYYSHKLKLYTNHLVYVPYFTGPKVPERFLGLPGARNADEIIVESESQKADYARVLGNNKEITICKSSKIESIQSMTLDDVVIPKSWSKKIKNKWVVLFNTGVNDFVNEYPTYFYEIEKNLKTLKERENTIIIWRPHPLLMQAIIATDRRFLDDYRRISDWFKTFGILDTSADLQRAVLLADEYYGDASSLCTLFKALNKKITLRY